MPCDLSIGDDVDAREMNESKSPWKRDEARGAMFTTSRWQNPAATTEPEEQPVLPFRSAGGALAPRGPPSRQSNIEVLTYGLVSEFAVAPQEGAI